MNKVLTVLTSGIAVASLTYAIAPSYLALILSFIITCLIVTLALWLDSIIKTNGNVAFNKLLYYFSRNDKFYNFLSLNCTYSCLDDKQYECRRSAKIKSYKKDLQGIDEHFRWSSNSSLAEIVPFEEKQKINSIHQEDDKTCYTVDFGKICPKHHCIDTGSIITNLHDPKDLAVPFLSCTIARKTKLLVLTVEFTKETLPKGKVIFKVKAFGNQVGESEVLNFNQQKSGYTKTIDFPRKGWQYIISWEKN